MVVEVGVGVDDGTPAAVRVQSGRLLCLSELTETLQPFSRFMLMVIVTEPCPLQSTLFHPLLVLSLAKQDVAGGRGGGCFLPTHLNHTLGVCGWRRG